MPRYQFSGFGKTEKILTRKHVISNLCLGSSVVYDCNCIVLRTDELHVVVNKGYVSLMIILSLTALIPLSMKS